MLAVWPAGHIQADAIASLAEQQGSVGEELAQLAAEHSHSARATWRKPKRPSRSWLRSRSCSSAFLTSMSCSAEVCRSSRSQSN